MVNKTSETLIAAVVVAAVTNGNGAGQEAVHVSAVVIDTILIVVHFRPLVGKAAEAVVVVLADILVSLILKISAIVVELQDLLLTEIAIHA